jgi:high-affinity iron transporter
MFGQYLLTFREAFEAMLLVSIIIAFLVKTGRKDLKKEVWTGIGISLGLSVILGAILIATFNGLSEAGEKLFESIAAFVAVIVLTWIILWMAFKGKNMRAEISNKVEGQVERGTKWGLIGLVFILVFREALETILFLTPFGVDDPAGTMGGFILGVLSAGVLSILIYKFGIKMDLGKFFKFSSILLIFLAAGLLGYGLHEFFEYFEETGTSVGWIASTAYDLGISDGSVFHHKGIIGSVFKVMLGYSTKMEWGRVILHSLYLSIFLPLILFAYRKKKSTIDVDQESKKISTTG